MKYAENLHNLHNNLLCFSERMKMEKFGIYMIYIVLQDLASLCVKTEYVIYIRSLKQALNYG